MFFIMGITEGRKDFPFQQLVICSFCGKYGRCSVFMTYTVLSLFFIPTIKWNRRYYVQMSCCGTVCELDPEIGKAIAAGRDVQILPQHLTRVVSGGAPASAVKRCGNCGFETAEDFDYCPKCGTRF